ncbi:LacI family transcriptional regulator [Prauserella sp. PE36]|uniref:LacI family DNA-binding transcriptional regulator n=1 Tax=Prauserella sp. PE36 TaxID=1504709 RepID=UPI000DE1D4AC|nr:LacI family DNA-binding transcriptional regulator [Prauserella sp. PE36]RBM21864.1 LacI family transcriptional regulator [Prauserella sp. PE36]
MATNSRKRAGRTSPATIYDVARMAGVSPSTVSRALNKPGRINAGTEHRIREIAEAIGYRLNPLARALPTGRTQTLALTLSDITNPVYFELIRGAERVAASRGYILILAESQESADLENETAQRLLSSVDGLILVAARLDSADIVELSRRKPILTVNRKVRGIGSVVADVRPGIQAALDHLRQLGHKRLAYLGGPPSSWMNRLRDRTISSEASDRGMKVVTLGPYLPTVAGGAAALDVVRESGATAALAYNDLMAIGLLKAGHEIGMRIPEQLSLIGFDDIFGSDFTSPPITTIRTPHALLGEQAALRLIAELNNEAVRKHTAPRTEFLQRASTDRART